MNVTKHVCMGLLAALGCATFSQHANAQTIYVTLNNNTDHDVTVPEPEWGQSYNPRIEGTIPAHSSKSGKLTLIDHEVGYRAYIHFKASFEAPVGNTQTCEYLEEHDIKTGALTSLTASSIAGSPYPVCTAEHNGDTSITYTIGER